MTDAELDALAYFSQQTKAAHPYPNQSALVHVHANKLDALIEEARAANRMRELLRECVDLLPRLTGYQRGFVERVEKELSV